MNSTPQEFYIRLTMILRRLLLLCSHWTIFAGKLGKDILVLETLRSALEEVHSLAQTFLKSKEEPEAEVPQKKSICPKIRD